MPSVWFDFGTREETEHAIGRLRFVGFERDAIDRIEGADGTWKVGVYVDERDAPEVRAILADPDAPEPKDVLAALLIFGAAALVGAVVGALLARRRDSRRRGAAPASRSRARVGRHV